jgi:hypothetical protein
MVFEVGRGNANNFGAAESDEMPRVPAFGADRTARVLKRV